MDRAAAVSMDLRPKWAAGRQATFHVSFLNNTPVPVAVALHATDATGALDLRVEPAGYVVMSPGGTGVITLSARPQARRLTGEPRSHTIALRGVQLGHEDESDPALVGQALFTDVPLTAALLGRRLPLWASIALAAPLLLLLLFAGGRMVTALSQSAPGTRTAGHGAIPAPTVAALPAITQFAVQAGPGGAVEVVWSVSQARVVWLSGQLVRSSGVQTLHLTGPTQLVLSAMGAGGTTAQVLQVAPSRAFLAAPPTVLSLPVIQQFAVRFDARTRHLMLVWRVSGATAARLNGVPVKPTGTRPVALAARPTIYLLEATNALGAASASIALPARPRLAVVKVALHVPSIEQFTLAHPRAGRPYTLVWRTADATGVTLNGRPVASSGSLDLPSPVQNGTYQLVASSADGRAAAQVRVAVSSS